MSRHAQPRPSGGWLSLALAVLAALGGASLASNVDAGPARVAIGWATVLAAGLFLLQYRSERVTSLRLARLDHARRRDAIRLREELAEAHHRSRLAVERSYAAAARAEALAAEVAQLMAVIRATPPPVASVQLLPVMTPAPIQAAPAAPVQPQVVPAAPKVPAAAAAAANNGTSLDLPLVPSRRERPFVSPSTPEAPVAPTRVRVDLRAVEPKARLARGA